MYRINYQKFKKFLSQSEITYQDNEYTYIHDIENFGLVLEGKKTVASNEFNQLKSEIYSIAIDLLLNKTQQAEVIHLNLEPDAKNVFFSKIQMAQFLVFDFIHSKNKSNIINYLDKTQFSDILFETDPNNPIFKQTLLKNSTVDESVIYNYSLVENIDFEFINNQSRVVNVSPQYIDYSSKESVIKIIEKNPEKISSILENIRHKMFEDTEVIEAILMNATIELVDSMKKDKSKGFLFSYMNEDGENIYPLLGDTTIKLAAQDSYLMNVLIDSLQDNGSKRFSYKVGSLGIVENAIFNTFEHPQHSTKKRLSKKDELTLKENKDLNLYKSYQKIVKVLEQSYFSSFETISPLITEATHIETIKLFSPFFSENLKYDSRFLKLIDHRLLNEKSNSANNEEILKLDLLKMKKEDLQNLFIEYPSLASNLLQKNDQFSYNKKTNVELLNNLSDKEFISKIIQRKSPDENSPNFDLESFNVYKLNYLNQLFDKLSEKKSNSFEINKEHMKEMIADTALSGLNTFRYIWDKYGYNSRQRDEEHIELLNYAIEKDNIEVLKNFPASCLFNIKDKKIIQTLSSKITFEDFFTSESKTKIPLEWLHDEEILLCIFPKKSFSSFFKLKKEYENIIFSSLDRAVKIVEKNPLAIKLVPEKYRETLQFQDSIIGFMNLNQYSNNKNYFNNNIWNRVEFCKEAIKNTDFIKHIPDKMFSNYEFLTHVATLVQKGRLTPTIFRFNSNLYEKIKDLDSDEIKPLINTLYNQQKLSVGLNFAEKQNTPIAKKIKI